LPTDLRDNALTIQMRTEGGGEKRGADHSCTAHASSGEVIQRLVRVEKGEGGGGENSTTPIPSSSPPLSWKNKAVSASKVWGERERGRYFLLPFLSLNSPNNANRHRKKKGRKGRKRFVFSCDLRLFRKPQAEPPCRKREKKKQ